MNAAYSILIIAGIYALLVAYGIYTDKRRAKRARPWISEDSAGDDFGG